jgi:hypothetical protein
VAPLFFDSIHLARADLAIRQTGWLSVPAFDAGNSFLFTARLTCEADSPVAVREPFLKSIEVRSTAE